MPIWDSLLIVFWMVSLVTYPITFTIGIPAYALLTQHSTLRLRHVLGLSGVVGLVAGMLMNWIRGGVPLGLSAGVAFWLIWHRE